MWVFWDSFMSPTVEYWVFYLCMCEGNWDELGTGSEKIKIRDKIVCTRWWMVLSLTVMTEIISEFRIIGKQEIGI